jgi:two-component system LytT family response regulator
MALRALVVEDEPFVRHDLRQLLEAYPDLEVAWEAGSVSQAREVLQHSCPDVIFLDVQLRGGDGFDLMADVSPSSALVFVTAYEQYALRAFEVNALDYLLKPISEERLAVTLARIRARPKSDAPTVGSNVPLRPDDRVLIRGGGRQDFICLQDIKAVTSLGGNYTCVHCINGAELTTRRTFKAWEKTLPSSLFLRVHRTVIVNLCHIQRLSRDSAGGLEMTMRGDAHPYPVSRRFASAVRLALGRG